MATIWPESGTLMVVAGACAANRAAKSETAASTARILRLVSAHTYPTETLTVWLTSVHRGPSEGTAPEGLREREAHEGYQRTLGRTVAGGGTGRARRDGAGASRRLHVHAGRRVRARDRQPG